MREREIENFVTDEQGLTCAKSSIGRMALMNTFVPMNVNDAFGRQE